MYLLRLLLLLCILSTSQAIAGDGIKSQQQAADEGKFFYLFVHKDLNHDSVRLEKVFNQAVHQLGARVVSAKINVNDPAESQIVQKFDLKRAPMPLALVVAPNGAIMGGFPGSFTEEQLIGSLSSVGVSECLKALQDRKLVFLCLQNDQTSDNHTALKGIMDFKADSRFGNASEVVIINPQDPTEQSFLKQLGVKVDGSQAITVMIVPPADIVGQYQGATLKESFVSDLKKATSGSCCPGGCCPNGCCPQKH